MKFMKVAGAIALLAASQFAQAQAWPSKGLTWIVPFAAGGPTDAMARDIADKVGKQIGQPIIVENLAGAGGTIGAAKAAKANPDGYTFLVGHMGYMGAGPALYKKLSYDPVKDFEPVGLVGYSPTLMVVNPALKVKDVKDLVRLLKEKPDQYSVASAGNGTAPHFAAELFKLSTQTSLLHVPYKGSAPAVNDTIGGQTHVMFPSLFTGTPFVKAGRLQALAIAGNKRSPLLPEVPTLKEMGVTGVEVDQWYALFAPAKTPKEVITKLNQALNKVLDDKDIIKKIEGHGADVETSSPEQLGDMVRKDLAKWRQVVQRAQLQAD